MDKAKIVGKIVAWCKENDCSGDMSIYYDDKGLRFDSEGKREKMLYGVKGSRYTEYANDETITMTFEGGLYGALNQHYGSALMESFTAMLDTEGVYYELGNAWNLAIYEN